MQCRPHGLWSALRLSVWHTHLVMCIAHYSSESCACQDAPCHMRTEILWYYKAPHQISAHFLTFSKMRIYYVCKESSKALPDVPSTSPYRLSETGKQSVSKRQTLRRSADRRIGLYCVFCFWCGKRKNAEGKGRCGVNMIWNYVNIAEKHSDKKASERPAGKRKL